MTDDLRKKIGDMSEEEAKAYVSEWVAEGLKDFIGQPSTPETRARMKKEILETTERQLAALGMNDEWTKVTGGTDDGKGLYTINIETRDPHVIMALYESDPDGTIYGVTREQYEEARACISIVVTMTVDTKDLIGDPE